MLAELSSCCMHTRFVRGLQAARIRLISVSRVWNPLGRVARRRLFQHAVNLFQAEALGLRNEEVGEEDTSGAGGAPHEEDLGLEVAVVFIDHVGRDEADDEVPEPIAGC